MSKSKAHQYALLSAQKMGWRVFPLRPRDKTPLTAHGFKDASDNPEQINRWWASNPKAGVGLPTGKINGLIVIDIDPRNHEGQEEGADGQIYARDAYEIAAELFMGDVPETWVVETPGGGLHFYFKHPGDRLVPGVKSWQPGVDIKSDGGYVCAPPSIHPNGGEYIWVEKPDATPLADLPTWMEAGLAKKQADRVAREIKGNLGDGRIRSGSRNDTLTSLAGTMQRRGMDPEAILAALLAENKAKCEPPLDEGEVLAIVASIGRYEPDPTVTPKTTPGKRREIALSDVSRLLSEPPPVDWIIPGRLAKGDCAIIVGPPGCGKSWITMDMAISGALGGKILDEWPVTQPLRVLYVDEENPSDEMNRRMHGIFNATVSNGHRHKAALDLEARLHVLTPCQGFTFRENEGWIEPLTELVSKIEPDLVIFDSLTAVSAILDENKATEVRAFFHDKLYPLRRICNSAILCVHHSNKKAYEIEGKETSVKDGHIRGSIDYLGAVDACLFTSLTKTQSGEVASRVLHQTKQRRDKEPPAVQWSLEGGHDPSGMLCIRPVVVEDGRSQKVTSASKRGVVLLAQGLSKDKSPEGVLHWIKANTDREDIDLRTVRRYLA